MLEPAVVVQKIVFGNSFLSSDSLPVAHTLVDAGGLLKSYLGPPESLQV